MTWLMFELARHPEIQRQVQEHIAKIGNVTYILSLQVLVMGQSVKLLHMKIHV